MESALPMAIRRRSRVSQRMPSKLTFLAPEGLVATSTKRITPSSPIEIDFASTATSNAFMVSSAIIGNRSTPGQISSIGTLAGDPDYNRWFQDRGVDLSRFATCAPDKGANSAQICSLLISSNPQRTTKWPTGNPLTSSHLVLPGEVWYSLSCRYK